MLPNRSTRTIAGSQHDRGVDELDDGRAVDRHAQRQLRAVVPWRGDRREALLVQDHSRSPLIATDASPPPVTEVPSTDSQHSADTSLQLTLDEIAAMVGHSPQATEPPGLVE
jgi:hypothetical protein